MNLIANQYFQYTPLILHMEKRVLFENLQLKGRRCNHRTTRTCRMRIYDCKYWFLLLYSPGFFFKWQGNKNIFLLHSLQDQCHLSAGNYFKCNIKNVWFFLFPYIDAWTSGNKKIIIMFCLKKYGTSLGCISVIIINLDVTEDKKLMISILMHK